MFLLALRLLLQLFCQAFVGCFLVFILVSVSGIFSLFFSLFAWVSSALSIGGCHSLPLFCVFLFVRPSWIICCFYLSCLLPFFSLLPRVLCGVLP